MSGALRRLYLPTFLVAAAAAVLAWRGWTVLSDFGPLRAIRSEQLELAGPAVVGFVLADRGRHRDRGHRLADDAAAARMTAVRRAWRRPGLPRRPRPPRPPGPVRPPGH
ncbi:MAG: hypothetical protein ABJB47_09295 [Actinomycetota bacterium]